MNELLSDEEVRHLAISLLTAPTARDAQTKIGASNLSNGCDYCLASNFIGDNRETPITDRAWMGKTLGTAQHGILEARMKQAQALMSEREADGAVEAIATLALRQIAERHPGAVAEDHVWIGEYAGYGKWGGTIDLNLLIQLIDWKGSTRKKSLLMQDYIRISQGLDTYYGRKHEFIKVSEKVYAESMLEQQYKVTGYYGQQNLYMHGDRLRGGQARKASLVFFNRDGTGWFDNPSESRYDDPTAVHDVWVMSFDYNEQYALDLIARGQTILTRLQAGEVPADFERHQFCFPCGLDRPSGSAAAVLAAPVQPATAPADGVRVGELVPA